MKSRLLIVTLIILNIVLLVSGLFDYLTRDSKAPTITLTNTSITYKEGEDTSKLLTGIKAYDEKDGDLTNEVFIEKIVVNSSDSAIVYYGVVDSANNAAIASRTVKYEKSEDEIDATVVDSITEDKTELK